MRKGIAILLVLLMALIMTACGGRGAVNEPEPGEAGETAADGAPIVDEAQEAAEAEAVREEAEESAGEGNASSGDGQVTVTVPEGWEALDSAGMLYAYQKGTASFMMKTEPFTVDTLDMVVHQSRDIISGVFDNVEFAGDAESVKVGGVDASKFLFTSDFAGFAMKFEYVYFFAGGDVYAVTFGDLDTTFDDNAADFQAILDGIVIE